MSALLDRFTGWFLRAKRPASIVLPVRLGASRQTATGSRPVQDMGFDQTLVWVTVALLAWGLVMVYSASISMPENPRFAQYTHTYFLAAMPFWLGLSFVAALLAFQVPVATWERRHLGCLWCHWSCSLSCCCPASGKRFMARGAGLAWGP